MSMTWLRTWSRQRTKGYKKGFREVSPLKGWRSRLRVETLEQRCLLSCDPNAVFRRIDGGCGNPFIEDAGEAGTQLLRQIPARYADGLSAPSGGSRRSGRDLSNRISDQSDPANPGSDLDIRDPRRLTDFIYVWGQFLDHDMDLTRDNTGQCFDIQVAATDPIGIDDSANCPGNTHVIPFRRSEFDPNTGTTNPRQQLNSDTAFIDGSMIYGSDDTKASILRSHVHGRLRTDATGRFLPKAGDAPDLATVDIANDAHVLPNSSMFVVGDRRGNETVSLATMHTLFMREHNRIADAIYAANPGFSDELIYQLARRRVGAEIQVIVYNEYIPALLGANALQAYTGFHPDVNAGIKTEFSTVFFRFGHSQLDNDVERTANNGVTIADGKLDLGLTFFDAPSVIGPGTAFDPISGRHMTGLEPLLKGPASAISQKVDQFAVTDIRNLLFGPLGAGGEDLIARDVQRARDHAIPNFNAVRQAYGLPALNRFFNDPAHGLIGITSNATLANTLSVAYNGNINNVDAFFGSICEDHVAGESVGPVTKASLVDQFTRLRDGDKFFYLNSFSGDELQDLLETTSLAKIIERNTGVTNLQSNVFFLNNSIHGTAFDATSGSSVPLAGVTVQLKDDTGTVIATATTNGAGSYTFDTPDDFAATGNYTILATKTGFSAVTTDPLAVSISRGDINIANADFTFVRSAGPVGGGPEVLLVDALSPHKPAQTVPNQTTLIETGAADAFVATVNSDWQPAPSSLGDSSDQSVGVVGALEHHDTGGIDSSKVDDLAQL
jgi:hypothetical protein